MTKVTITIPASILPYFQRLAQNYLAYPAFKTRNPTVAKLLLLEWVLSKIQKLHPVSPKDSPKFRIKHSEALALYETLEDLQISDILQDSDRNQLIDDIARQMPFLLHQSPA